MRVAIGARLNDEIGIDSGHCRVYEWKNNKWEQLGGDIVGEAAGDESGSSISLSADGMTVAIGARLNDDNGIESGHCRVYGWKNNKWEQLGGDIIGEAADDHSGSSISLSADGMRVAIGARHNDDNGFS
eukprot:scaffold13680_cov29-Attheya_sp.AAC.2